MNHSNLASVQWTSDEKSGYSRNTPLILNCHLWSNEPRQALMAVLSSSCLVFLFLVMIMAWISEHHAFAPFIFSNTGESAIATEPLMPTLCYIRMMLFQIENHYCKMALANGRYTRRHNSVLDELVRIIRNLMTPESNKSTQKFITEVGAKYMLVQRNRLTIELYPVKIFLD